MIIEGENDNGIETDTTPNDTGNEGGDGGNNTNTEGSDTAATVDPVPSIEQQAEDAFSKGVEKATVPKDDGDATTKEAAATAKPADGKTDAGAAKPVVGADGKTPKAEAPKRDIDVEKEVKNLGLKGKAADRFHEMAGQLKTQTALIEPLAKVGIKAPADVQDLLNRASEALEWETTIARSTATPEQFNSAMQVIAAMNSNDPKYKNAAFDELFKQITHLGKELGRDMPGIIDALAGHPDLLAAVDAMDMTREKAVELARARATLQQVQKRDSTNQQRTQEQEQQTATQARVSAEIDSLSDQLKAQDPLFAQKLQILVNSGMLAAIKEKNPITKWPGEIAKAYALVVVPSPAPAQASQPRVRPGNVPIRGGAGAGGNAQGGRQALPQNDEEAFMMGVEAARRS